MGSKLGERDNPVDSASSSSTSAPRQSRKITNVLSHGIDSLNCTLASLCETAAMGLGSTPKGVFTALIPCLPMFFSTWETYHTHTLYLGYFNGPTGKKSFSLVLGCTDNHARGPYPSLYIHDPVRLLWAANMAAPNHESPRPSRNLRGILLSRLVDTNHLVDFLRCSLAGLCVQRNQGPACTGSFCSSGLSRMDAYLRLHRIYRCLALLSVLDPDA